MPGSLVGFLADGAACGLAQFDDAIVRGRELLEGRTFWNVSSPAHGGGVAEMLRSLIGYVFSRPAYPWIEDGQTGCGELSSVGVGCLGGGDACDGDAEG
jgi:hypothetical protein